MGLLALTSAAATDYTGQLTISLNGSAGTPSTNTVTVEDNGNDTYNLSIKDFSYSVLNLGDINVTNIPGEKQSDGSVKIRGSQEISVKLSVLPIPVTVKIDGTLSADRAKFDTDLDMGNVMGQTVTATFSGTNPEPTALKPATPADVTIQAIYDVTGKKVNTMGKGLYIIKYSDGSAKKVVKK